MKYDFLTEMWGLYAVGSCIFTTRFIIRLRTVGIRGFCADDYFALLAWAFYTGDGVTVMNAYVYKTNLDYTFTYPALIWSMKAIMVMFFRRLTLGLWLRRIVNYLGILCIFSYIAVVITVFAGCRPFSANWEVYPLPGMECTFRLQNIIVVSVSNIVTDVALLFVPVPLLFKVKIPTKQKIGTAVFLLTGVFVIIAAVIRLTITVGSSPSTTTINTWGVRETAIGILCVNLPILRPLFSSKFWTSPTWKLDSTTNSIAHAPHHSERLPNSSSSARSLRLSEEGIATLDDNNSGNNFVMNNLQGDSKIVVLNEVEVNYNETAKYSYDKVHYTANVRS
ncbi:hypothetical protein PVAG01_01947 [Phlyctema vagabunda]|uniref:Rhodopsin domain-containing protein n=1 Tax=Phlyctema vagabunda TaxID=108571 RepID=A0ABR4PZ06_9HELO